MAAPLTKRAVDAAEPRTGEYFIWCGKLAGFGARIYSSGRKVFVAQVRIGRAQRRVKIGPYGALTVEQARERAKTIIQTAADGRDPQREKREMRGAITVAELCQEYLKAARTGLVITRFQREKSPRTVVIDEGRISRHILPLIGTIPARDLCRADVQRMLDAISAGKTAITLKTKPRGRAVVRGGAGTAARAVGVLGGIYTWARRRGLVPDGLNPAHGVEKAVSKARDRVLRTNELRTLGEVLDSRQDSAPAAVAAVRLIALTGLRRDEACGLRWREIDELGHCLRLERTKTGRSVRPIGKAAMEHLRGLPRRDESEWAFPRADGKAPVDMKKSIVAVFDAAGLTDARSHDLRRTFASVAADLGFGDATIAELLGHARQGVTERHYVRRSDPVLLAAADKVSAVIHSALSISRSSDVHRSPERATAPR